MQQINYPDDNCYGPDARATPFERSSIQERISAKFGKSIAQLSVRMAYVYRPDGTAI
jgi:hypothetical protein